MRARIHSVLVACLTVGALVVPVTAAQAATGVLKGTVQGPSGGGVPGICIEIHPAGDLTSYTQATTGAGGAYAVTVDAGTYNLRFRDCDGTANGSLAAEWWLDSRTFDGAQTITVTGGGEATANATLAAGGTITGAVVDDADAALAGACVTASDPMHPDVKGSAVANGSGVFTIAGLPAGTYVLSGSDCAHSPAQQATAFYGPNGSVARGAADAAELTVAGGASTTVGKLVLPDAGTVTGQIGDKDLNPVQNACVTLIDLDSNTSHGTTTDGTGSYSVDGLLPGNWIARVTDCTGAAPEDQFATVYLLANGTTTTDPSVAEANALVITDGTTALQARQVTPGGAVAGKVLESSNRAALRARQAAGDPYPGACVGAVPTGSLRIVSSTVADASGGYTLGGLSPKETYRIAAYDCRYPRRFGLEWSSSALIASEATQVSVQAGTTQAGRNVTVGDFVRRAAGADRIQTAVDLALGAFTSTIDVVVARSDAYPDALAGAPLAATLNAPILLSPPGSLPSSVASAIQTLGATRVTMLGGTAALSQTVENQLDALVGAANVRRIQGINRFETARAIASQLPASDHAYVVEGTNPDPNRGWPDAVSVAGLAAFERAPLLLVARDTVPSATAAALGDYATAVIVGGEAAVSTDTAVAIDGLVGTVQRVFGADRYETSEAVVQRALASGAWSRTLWLATGTAFPDALVAGAVVGQDGGILKLVYGPNAAASSSFAGPISDRASQTDRLVLLGGTAAISAASQAQVEALLGQ